MYLYSASRPTQARSVNYTASRRTPLRSQPRRQVRIYRENSSFKYNRKLIFAGGG